VRNATVEAAPQEKLSSMVVQSPSSFILPPNHHPIVPGPTFPWLRVTVGMTT
jgi:hypothetical protein